jgi:hypothetical protein
VCARVCLRVHASVTVCVFAELKTGIIVHDCCCVHNVNVYVNVTTGPILSNVEAISVNQQWAGHPGRLIKTIEKTLPSQFPVALECDGSDAQKDWVLGACGSFQTNHKKRILCTRFLMVKDERLPRQARDKHKDSLKETCALPSQGPSWWPATTPAGSIPAHQSSALMRGCMSRS